MFKRYTDECKRAIFLAQQTALHEGAAAINSTHLLLGLLREADSRANSIFRLREVLPADVAQLAASTKQELSKGIIPLTTDGKRVVAYTAREANRLRDYWIDTEHLVLGILREGENAAAVKLGTAGLDLERSRQQVIESKSSRPRRPDPVLWWARKRRGAFGIALVVVFLLGVIVAVKLLGFGGAR
jgi:ATP-dependent Clp protease ATP-binding subunit ClpC